MLPTAVTPTWFSARGRLAVDGWYELSDAIGESVALHIRGAGSGLVFERKRETRPKGRHLAVFDLDVELDHLGNAQIA